MSKDKKEVEARRSPARRAEEERETRERQEEAKERQARETKEREDTGKQMNKGTKSGSGGPGVAPEAKLASTSVSVTTKGTLSVR